MNYSKTPNRKISYISLPRYLDEFISTSSRKLDISKSAYIEILLMEAVQNNEQQKIEAIEKWLISKKITTSHNRHYMSLLFKLRKKYHETTKEVQK